MLWRVLQNRQFLQVQRYLELDWRHLNILRCKKKMQNPIEGWCSLRRNFQLPVLTRRIQKWYQTGDENYKVSKGEGCPLCRARRQHYEEGWPHGLDSGHTQPQRAGKRLPKQCNWNDTIISLNKWASFKSRKMQMFRNKCESNPWC